MFGSSGKKNSGQFIMTRKETAVWLGRALSTSEVNLQTMLKLVQIMIFQQKVIDELYKEIRESLDEVPKADIFVELDEGASGQILTKLEEIEEQLKPIATMVSQACEQLQKEI